MRKPPLRVLLRQPAFLLGMVLDGVGVVTVVIGATRIAAGGLNATMLIGIGLLVGASGLLGLGIYLAQRERPPSDGSDGSDATQATIY